VFAAFLKEIMPIICTFHIHCVYNWMACGTASIQYVLLWFMVCIC